MPAVSSAGPTGRSAAAAGSDAPLLRQPLYARVAERLREDIYRDRLAPGERIDELALAERYGTSRTPLREALKVLASEGLVTMRVGRGAFVTEVTPAEAGEIYAVLALLEAEAAARVAAGASAAQRQALQRTHAQLRASVDDRDRFFALNEQFHRMLMEMAGNRRAIHVCDDLRKVVRLHRHHSLDREGRVGASLAEHDALMEAIAAGDASAARTVMQQHIGQALGGG